MFIYLFAPWEILHAFLASAVFFKINFFEKYFQESHQSVKQFGLCSGPTKLSGLILVQTVCKSYQQTTLEGNELICVFYPCLLILQLSRKLIIVMVVVAYTAVLILAGTVTSYPRTILHTTTQHTEQKCLSQIKNQNVIL